jgi:radical SAM superfamily enzyme YgiQ (UPF0313 family)
MKVLLIQPPYNKAIALGCRRGYSEEARSPLPPLGLLYLAGHLKKNHDVKVLDMTLPNQKLSDAIRSGPDIIGIPSLIGLWPTVVDIFNLVKYINPFIHTVVGGPNATQYPEETLTFKNIDFLITGLGQFPMMELCNQLEKGQSGEGIENCYVQGKKYDSYRTGYPHELDDFEFPNREVTPFKEYYVGFCPENPTTTMITSMGCPFRCAFCNVHNQHLEIRSAESVVDEIEAIQRMGIKSILFNDELFTLIPNRVREICEGLIKRKIKIHWSIKSRIDCIQDWMPALMKGAGCFNIHFGIESGNNSTLERMKKGYDTEEIVDAVLMVKASGLSCTANFMLGYPGESEKHIRNTIAFAKSLDLDLAQYSITMDIPNTELFDEAIASQRLHMNHWSEFTKNPERTDLVEMFSSELPREKLLELLDEAHSSTKTLYDINPEMVSYGMAKS